MICDEIKISCDRKIHGTGAAKIFEGQNRYMITTENRKIPALKDRDIRKRILK
jgi:hypothetical protein